MRTALAALALALASPAIAGEWYTGPVRVIDGDSLEVGNRKTRIHGIDAFEVRQRCAGTPCGQIATQAMQEAIRGRMVRCEALDRDRYGRTIARCFAARQGAQGPGLDIGGHMVAQGWALAYRRYSRDYVGAERSAQRDRLGAWAGAFVAPWVWRRR